jgi:hypothetical protein
MMGLPEPADEIEAAVQLAASGYGPEQDLLSALAGAELAVWVRADGQPVTAAAPDGSPVLPAFSSAVYLESSGAFAAEWIPVAELLERVPEDHSLYLNPTGPVAIRLETQQLRAALKDRLQDPALMPATAGAGEAEEETADVGGPEETAVHAELTAALSGQVATIGGVV